jgi:invasion protein IalB
VERGNVLTGKSSEDIHYVNLRAIAKDMFLKVGDAVVADVFISKTGMNEAANRRWTLPGGRVIEEGHTHKVNGVLESF